MKDPDLSGAVKRGKAAPWYRRHPEWILSPLVLFAFLTVWEATVRWFDVPNYVLPSVGEVFTALVRGLSAGPFARDGYWPHIGATFSEIIIGFVTGSLLGLMLGVLISQSRLLELTLRPYIVAFQSLPKVAVAPIIVLWFGYGLSSKVITVSLLTFFPLLVTSLAGFKSVESDRIDLMRAMSASRWQIFTKIQLPGAAPFIFAGLDIAIVFAVVGAIVGEFVGAQIGLGVQIMQMNAALDVAGSFSVFIILSLIGLGLSHSLRMIERAVLFWSPSSDQRNTVNA
jgi:NitT/TauT family transport system permease protein